MRWCRVSANGVVVAGELLWVRQQTLLARPIDADGKLGGEPRTLVPELLYDPSTWRATFTATADRILFAPGGKAHGTHLSRVDRSGRPLGEVAGDGEYFDLRLSPDGQRLLVTEESARPTSGCSISSAARRAVSHSSR